MSSLSLQRIGGVAAIGAGVITQASGAMHPVETATLFDPVVHLHEVAANGLWNGVYFGFSMGFVLMLIGLTVIARSVNDPGGAAWAAIAGQVAAATTAVALVFFLVDGFATKTVALAVVASNDNPEVVAAAAAIDRLGRAYFGHWTMLCWGVTPLLFGITVVRSTRFPRWLGAVPLLSGTVGFVTGALQDFSDFSLNLLPGFYIAVLLFNLFLIAMGVTLLRSKPETAR